MPQTNRLSHYLSEIKIFWPKLIGRTDLFPLESRIFHSISIGMSGLMVLYIPYNLSAGLYTAAFSAFGIGVFFLYQYYFSRFKRKPHSSLLFGLLGIVLFTINYFSNSGIHGSTDLIWPIYLLLVFAISPYRQHLAWLIVYIAGFVAIHVIEYYYPSLVKYPFNIGKGQFIDRLTAFPIPVIGVYIIINFIRRSYDKDRDQLERSNIEKNKMMSIISHDLRTPLINIQNYLKLLNEHDLAGNERLALEKTLLNSTNNAMEMLSNLLHWSKSQMEGSSVNIVETNLLSLLSSTLEMEKTHAQKKGVSLSFVIPPQLTVAADENMLQLVVRNLISNAIKFTPKDGFIRIDAHTIGTNCKLTVSDSGKGISPAKQKHIFSIKAEPEYGTNNEKGVGLGLVLCKEFIEVQGGTIGFESSPEKGASFYIFLPLQLPLN
ncbi:MAG: sensor histidine kinase [Bacteroidia bacterium]